MIQLTRRNFLLGVAASGLLTLQPPALVLAEVKELIIEKPRLTTAFIKGISVGEITRETTPEPCDIVLSEFTLTAEAQTMDITPSGSKFRHTGISSIDWTVEAWIRAETNYIGEVMRLRLKASTDAYYSGEFFITEYNLYLDGPIR